MDPTRAIDIIFRIQVGADGLQSVLRRLVQHTDFKRHHLCLLHCESTIPALQAALVNAPNVEVRPHLPGQNHVAALNEALSRSCRDVLLLQDDIEVSAGWLDQLSAAAESMPQVGTVSPLCNHAELCSVPQGFAENLLPTGFDLDGFSALVRDVADGSQPDLPLAFGSCVYIRRALFDEIGLFDATRFASIEAALVAFCLRASQRGWSHRVDPLTYVQRAALRRIQSVTTAPHPGVVSALKRCRENDPLASTRLRIVDALRRHSGTAPSANTQGPQRVVHLVHGWPPLAMGGTEHYAWWLAHHQRRFREVSVYARFDDRNRAQGVPLELNDHGVRVRLLNNHFLQRNPFDRNSIHAPRLERDFERFLREQQPDLVHVHHLVGHALGLSRVIRRLGIPLVQQVQDWWPLCARANLTHVDKVRCSGPALLKCSRCAVLTRIRPMGLSNLLLHGVRKLAARRALARADAYVMGSEFIRADYQRAGLFDAGKPVHVLEYGVEIPAARIPRQAAARPLRCAFIGSPEPHKGLQIARAAFAEIDPAVATLELWGYAGKLFAEADKDQVYASMDVLLFPSVGLESFGLAAREAMARGVPVIATYDGALMEMRDARFFPSGDAAALRAIILELAADPAQVDAWSQRLQPVKSTGAHAAEIEAVYAGVLAGRS